MSGRRRLSERVALARHVTDIPNAEHREKLDSHPPSTTTTVTVIVIHAPPAPSSVYASPSILSPCIAAARSGDMLGERETKRARVSPTSPSSSDSLLLGERET